MYVVLVSLFILIATSNCAKERCETCKDMAEKFREGMERTSGHNFGGGNTDWEETRLGSFADSETRLVDIIEGVCSSTECHSLVEQHEEDIEYWWFKGKPKGVELEPWLCVHTVRVCCPKGKFGPDCVDCPGGSDSPCSEHGNCKGDGSRTGSGECECEEAYAGKKCDECKEGFYQDTNNASELSCLKCHESCDGPCHDGSTKGCETCKDGWEHTEDDGCIDKNECELSDVCESTKYCVNTPGSFKCEGCDRSCEENCTGEGPKGCLACKTGYDMTDTEGCKDKDECAEGDVTCEDGQHCSNTPGAYDCVACHEACAKCTEQGAEKCTECNSGYELTEKGCNDKNECREGSVTCEDGQRCKNTPGSYRCVACNKACAKCTKRGPEKCTECNLGYELTEKGCEDIDECKDKLLCPGENESCENMAGNYLCKCSSGFKREEGKCVKEKQPADEGDDVTKDDEDLDDDDDVIDGDVNDDDVNDDVNDVDDDDDDADLDDLIREDL